MQLDAGLCIEFTVKTADENFPVIYRPANLKEFQLYMQADFPEQVRREYEALSCECTHIYIKGNNGPAAVEFYIGNDTPAMDMWLLEGDVENGMARKGEG